MADGVVNHGAVNRIDCEQECYNTVAALACLEILHVCVNSRYGVFCPDCEPEADIDIPVAHVVIDGGGCSRVDRQRQRHRAVAAVRCLKVVLVDIYTRKPVLKAGYAESVAVVRFALAYVIVQRHRYCRIHEQVQCNRAVAAARRRVASRVDAGCHLVEAVLRIGGTLAYRVIVRYVIFLVHRQIQRHRTVAAMLRVVGLCEGVRAGGEVIREYAEPVLHVRLPFAHFVVKCGVF